MFGFNYPSQQHNSVIPPTLDRPTLHGVGLFSHAVGARYLTNQCSCRNDLVSNYIYPCHNCGARSTWQNTTRCTTFTRGCPMRPMRLAASPLIRIPATLRHVTQVIKNRVDTIRREPLLRRNSGTISYRNFKRCKSEPSKTRPCGVA